MYYAEESLKEMSADYQAVQGQLDQLVETYYLRPFRNSRAKEHASHGFTRRLKVMVRCIDNVFTNDSARAR